MSRCPLLPDYRKENLSIVLIVPISRPVAQTEGDIHGDVRAVHPAGRNRHLNVELAEMMVISMAEFDDKAGEDHRRLRDRRREGYAGGHHLRAASGDGAERLRTGLDLHLVLLLYASHGGGAGWG